MTSPRTIVNPQNGQTIIFRKTAEDTNGALLEMESLHPPTGVKEPEHVHPKQESSFEVLSGTLHLSVNGNVQTVGPGEKIIIPPGVPHYFWNEGPLEAQSVQTFLPALTMEHFLRTYFALANAGKLNRKGMPPLFITARLGLKHQQDIQIIKPPWIMQKILYLLLAPIGKITGLSKL